MGSLDGWQDMGNSPIPGQEGLAFWNDIKNLQPQSSLVMYSRQEGVVAGRLDMLVQKIDALESKFDLILSRLDNIESIIEEGEVVELRDIPKDQAKAEIKEFFKEHHGENLHASYIEEELLIDFDMVMECMGELESEGAIKEA